MLSLIEECDLQLSVTLVPSANNKADSQTCMPQRWPKVPTACPAAKQVMCAAGDDPPSKIAEVHHVAGYPGMKRTLYSAKSQPSSHPETGIRCRHQL